MKKTIILLLMQAIIGTTLFAQSGPPSTPKYTIAPYKGKTYIFDQNQQITECDALGAAAASDTKTGYKGGLFTVEHVDAASGDLVIKFHKYKKNTLKADKKNPDQPQVQSALPEIYNFKNATDTQGDKNPYAQIRYFLLRKDDALISTSEYRPEAAWDITFGTLTTPFKLRPSKMVFTSNLNLGTSISYQLKVADNWSVGGVLGLSLSSVTLDSASTTGFAKTSSERPALTPSLSALASYKNISFTFGIGIDWINRPSALEQSWVFNGKPWIGFGIGLSLFNSNGPANATKASEAQK